jgi:hypothetical protein
LCSSAPLSVLDLALGVHCIDHSLPEIVGQDIGLPDVPETGLNAAKLTSSTVHSKTGMPTSINCASKVGPVCDIAERPVPNSSRMGACAALDCFDLFPQTQCSMEAAWLTRLSFYRTGR